MKLQWIVSYPRRFVAFSKNEKEKKQHKKGDTLGYFFSVTTFNGKNSMDVFKVSHNVGSAKHTSTS